MNAKRALDPGHLFGAHTPTITHNPKASPVGAFGQERAAKAGTGKPPASSKIDYLVVVEH